MSAPDLSQRLPLAYKLAEQGAKTVGAQLMLRASAVTWFAAEAAKGSNAPGDYLRALADELEGGR